MPLKIQQYDVLIIGAGAAGLMCAIYAGRRGRKVKVLEKANKPGKKILMSGGGRCNFTNLDIRSERYQSHNSSFCISALKRYTQWDFIALVEQHRIPFHEKKLGQLFCDHKSQTILNLLLTECENANVEMALNISINKIDKITNYHYRVSTNNEIFEAASLVIATGGLSIPTMGASSFGFDIAKQFGIHVWPTRAGLVPFIFNDSDHARFNHLTGISTDARVKTLDIHFHENILFTHRGLSGPAALQISSYWKNHETISIDMLPTLNLSDALKQARHTDPHKQLKTYLSLYFSKRLIDTFLLASFLDKSLADLSNQDIRLIADTFHDWLIQPRTTEGYRTAEVTLGGVDCNEISSKTMEAIHHPGLFFIGEVLDVTGWLGGYNFQWAWSSGWAAGQIV